MRVTAVPAEVTTVEDRIAGSLGMGQVVLLFIPILFGSLLYAGLPPAMHSAAYKLVILTVLLSVCCLLAIRIKGKIVLFWTVILLRYWLRPRYYVFDKRSLHGRDQYQAPIDAVLDNETADDAVQALPVSNLSLADMVKVNELIENPATQVVYEFKKGGLYVRFEQVEQES